MSCLKAPPFSKPGSGTGLPLNRRRFTTSATGFPLPLRHFRTLPSLLSPVRGLKTILSRPSKIPAILESNSGATTTQEKDHLSDPPVRIVALVGHGALSPLKSAPWDEVMLHTVSIHTTISFFWKRETFIST